MTPRTRDTLLQLLRQLGDVDAQWVLERWLKERPHLLQAVAAAEVGGATGTPSSAETIDTAAAADAAEEVPASPAPPPRAPTEQPVGEAPRLVGPEKVPRAVEVEFQAVLLGGSECTILAEPGEMLRELRPRICAGLGVEPPGADLALIAGSDVLLDTDAAAKLAGRSLTAVRVPADAWCTGQRFSRFTEEGADEVVTNQWVVELWADGVFHYERHYKYHDVWAGDTSYKDEFADGVWQYEEDSVLLHGAAQRSREEAFSKRFTRAELGSWEATALGAASRERC